MRHLAIDIGQIYSVADQAAGRDILSKMVDRRERAPGRQDNELSAAGVEKWIGGDDPSSRAPQ
jgi:hypothetical protein